MEEHASSAAPTFRALIEHKPSSITDDVPWLVTYYRDDEVVGRDWASSHERAVEKARDAGRKMRERETSPEQHKPEWVTL